MGYYIAIQGVQHGPFEAQDLPGKGMRPESLVWTEGMSDWQPAATVDDLARLFPQARAHEAPAPAYAAAPTPAPGQPQYLGYQSNFGNPSNGMAVASMVLGIVSFPVSLFWCAGTITAILAVIFGFIARARIKRGETLVGGGMALSGIILGFVHLGLIVLFLVALVIALAAGGLR
jgi:hypothetical protein